MTYAAPEKTARGAKLVIKKFKTVKSVHNVLEDITRTTFMEKFLAIHGCADQYSPGVHYGPGFKLSWTGSPGGKSGATTIENDHDFNVAISALMKKKKDACAHHFHTEAADQDQDEELAYGTKAPRFDTFSEVFFQYASGLPSCHLVKNPSCQTCTGSPIMKPLVDGTNNQICVTYTSLSFSPSSEKKGVAIQNVVTSDRYVKTEDAIEQPSSFLLSIEALLTHPDYSPHLFASQELTTALFRNMLLLCVLFHFKSCEERGVMTCLVPVLAEIATKTSTLVLENVHDAASEIEHRTVIRHEYAHSDISKHLLFLTA
ncbi:hypothetical protein BDR06DRAFT_1014292 [Suillus hirtellus]|nr:hypothetical protein BDR06DRAFT_1014821 [Suillus hirtellus]KAG2046986.1 hypothetical protein BDR06DRAFT_1014289 [Suillus hirtellus]KAG2046989.1 hypothetical protein BDR06DRAFT_1014292 [Suillus hirtellus]